MCVVRFAGEMAWKYWYVNDMRRIVLFFSSVDLDLMYKIFCLESKDFNAGVISECV